jgi:hypothetical protein
MFIPDSEAKKAPDTGSLMLIVMSMRRMIVTSATATKNHLMEILLNITHYVKNGNI